MRKFCSVPTLTRLLFLILLPNSPVVNTVVFPIEKLASWAISIDSVEYNLSGFALYINCLVGPCPRHCNPLPYIPLSSATNSSGVVRSLRTSAVISSTCNLCAVISPCTVKSPYTVGLLLI